MTEKLKFVAEIILNDKIIEFNQLISEQGTSDKPTFLKRHKKILENVIDFDYYLETQEKLSAVTIFIAVASKNKLMMTVDWSGEEYPGQVKRGITEILKQQHINPIKWVNKNMEKDILASQPKRGEFLPLLFRKLDEELAVRSFSLGFFECGDDAFHFFVLSKTDFEKIINIKEDDFFILDTNIYELHLTAIGTNASKVMIYLKNRFNIPLSEIKSFTQQEELLLATGNLAIVDFVKNEVESLGAKTEIRKTS